MRITISITKEDLQLIDDYCKSTGIKRSTFLTRSALKEVGVHQKDIDHDYPKTKKATAPEEEYFNPVPKPKKGK